MTFRGISCSTFQCTTAPCLHFQSCWNTHIHASWIEATFRHSSLSFYRRYSLVEHFTGISILLVRRIKTIKYIRQQFLYVYSMLLSPLPRFGFLTVFLLPFIPCFLFRILLRTKFSNGKNSWEHSREPALLSKPVDRKRDRYSVKCSPIVKPIDRYIGNSG